MCTDLAAANCYKIEHLKENWSVVEKAKAYFVGGYHLTVCVPAALALAEEAAKKNKVGGFCNPCQLLRANCSA
jgi:adenosine kinase